MSPSSDAALEHLKRLKPLDGWSVETKNESKTVRLLRRNVALTDNFFLDVHYDRKSGNVVGILTPNRGNGTAQAQVLVTEKGQPTGKKMNLIQVQGWEPARSWNTGPTVSGRQRRAFDTSNFEASAHPQFSAEDQERLLNFGKYMGMAVFASIFVKLLITAAYGLALLAVPLVYLYLLANIPSVESFDAKKELKRVLRGQHLPENHVDKPQGFFGKALARVNATVTTEVATGLSGYTEEVWTLAGAAHVVSVQVPAANLEAYWIGAAGQWRYVYSRQLVVPGRDKQD